MQFIKDIFEFNQRVLNLKPLISVSALDESVAKISFESMLEEADEFAFAVEKQDFVEAVDSLMDLVYFGIGVLFKQGLTNIEVARGLTKLLLKSGDQRIDVVKSIQDSMMHFGHVPGELDFKNSDQLLQLCDEVKERIHEFQFYCAEQDLFNQVETVVDICLMAIEMTVALGLQHSAINSILKAIHEANMAKKLGVNAKRGDGVAADAVKPEGWTPPEETIRNIINAQGNLSELLN